MNSARGNKFYDFSNPLDPAYKSPAHAEAAPGTSTDADSWQPPPAQRGDIARALFYMTVRYTGDVPGEPLLLLTDATNTIAANTNFMGRFTTLLQWHFADPVDAAEQRRNDEVCWLYQTNRNPFVDHPEFVASAFLPPLQIAAAGTNILLRWTANSAPTLQPETTTDLAAAWTPLTNAPTLTSNTWTLPAPVTAPAPSRFYRLSLR